MSATPTRIASAALDAGFEFMGHGFVQWPMHKIENQADAIKRSVETISKFAGKPPRSWERPGLTEIKETLNLLRLNGIEYVADWVIDDLPQDIATPHGTITTIPYSVETKDIAIHALQHLPSEPETLHRSVRPAVSRRRVERADHDNIDSPLYHGCAASHQVSRGTARLCPRSRWRCIDDGQRNWRLVSRRDGKELKSRSTAEPPASFGDPLTRTRLRK
jgi:hypothetical protein